MEISQNSNNLERLAGQFNIDEFKVLNEEMSFSSYVDLVYQNPRIIRTAHQLVYDMIMSKGTEERKLFRKTYVHYNFFDNSEIPIFGLDDTLDELVQFFKAGARGFGPEKRVLLLHGPVGSSKSTICRAIKQGLEDYSRTADGAWYSFRWQNLPEDVYASTEDDSPMHEDPIKLFPPEIRNNLVKELNSVLVEQTPEEDRSELYRLICNGDLDPRSKKFMKLLLDKYEGNWSKVVNDHIVVVRKTFCEADRMGIATFQPKDEKNQDSTELTGDINWGKLPHYGTDSDPRAFNFDGEFCVGNRGVIEFIEMLKLAKEFLYDLLGASQEQSIKPKKFSQVSVNTVLIGHTNNPEYEKLKNDQTMEALRDRTVKIDVPYLLKWSDELKILEHYYGKESVSCHIAPHTLEIAALWAVLTRLQDDKENKLTLVDKAKLYDGKYLPGWTEDGVKELKEKHADEGMYGGISCRYLQDKIANCLASRHNHINMFMVLNELKAGLDQSSLITNQDEQERYINCIDLARKELDEILKSEVQRALVGDEEAIIRLCGNYIDNVMAYINKSKIINPITQQEQQPNEKLMRSIEEKIDIPEVGVDDFRRMLAAFIGDLAHKKQVFKWDSNPKLKQALEAKLFEDTKDHIKLSALNISGATVVDKDIQEKIDHLKQRLIKQYGYNEQSATDVLDYVGSIFARGDLAEDDE
jgi:serine protein kinase